MKLALRYMGEQHRFREKPQIVNICTGQSITIPFGKRYFAPDPCKYTHSCNPLIAKHDTLENLRRLHKPQCCNGFSKSKKSRR